MQLQPQKIAVFGSVFPDRSAEGERRFCDVCAVISQYRAQIYLAEAFFDSLSRSSKDMLRPMAILFDVLPPVDMAFSIGGDGTFLRTAAVIGSSNIPVLGVNTGRLGFLADVPYKGMEETLGEILRGDYRTESRTLLETVTEESSTPFGYEIRALNEVAILKQETASMLSIHASINGEYLTTYQADGLIVATPTGSTAYALSIGGPILMPTSSSIILAAIAPHSLTSRPLVVDDNSRISLKVESRSRNFLVSMDGESQIFSERSAIEIRKADYSIQVVKRIGTTFFDTLRDKLMWGADLRS
ncbi:MAG: NAD kinase [Dysgonamonadaceae bacterium]|jgi:NAD+ kinase|nr:NAD kinase [Dysgonamonadaceae bacterium]